jgi:hypothetical protein
MLIVFHWESTMDDDSLPGRVRPAYANHASPRPAATITHLATRRRANDVIQTLTFVFGGVNYGTLTVHAPYVTGKPVVLYLVPAAGEPNGADFSGPLEGLITDDASLAYANAR